MEGELIDSSLDLSHLTEEEQSTILQVLERDLDLRHRDEGRVRVLQQTETDLSRFRFLSGAWFSEELGKRHRNWTSGCALVHATIRHRKTKNRDVPLTELFNEEREETSRNNNTSPEETRLKDRREEESGGSQGSLKPVPTPTTKTPLAQGLQHSNSSSSSKGMDVSQSMPLYLFSCLLVLLLTHSQLLLLIECERRSNGYSEEPEEDFDGHNGETDSLSSCLTEPDPNSLKTSSSTSSLHSGYTLSGSMMSLFSSGDFGLVEVRGSIQFSLVYDTQKEELQVKVYRCEDIAPARKNRSDPYVKSYLLPDKSSHSKKKTAVKKKTLNPVYDQTLRYKVRIGELRSRTLNLSVWHAEHLSRNVFLGEVEVSLGLWDWTCTLPLWQDLQPRVNLNPDSITSRGTILLSIKFIPDGFEGGGLPLTGELHIWLREAQGLLANKGGFIDSFVRSYILPDASRQSGQKTRVVKRSINPTYNHTMVYDGFHSSDLREACAELTVWQREGLKQHVLGGVRLSCGTGQSYGEDVSWMDSTGEEVAVWTSMIENPNHWVDATLSIRTNLAHRSQ
ncbi:synaptotagmin-like protein 1 isoform X1 [Sander lucioperca]|uniref:synaptotagmin-like protein 1 isoform X1 n=1 Tax=Sander lucioperca TaxID=283035 RepID=UPI001653494E|nr:synaptotagmin-like protein 1 isoform X1 [Sander lucioperca]XP_035849161.1 synaptotagmin-like protein 1 isoform X1 [Sander lucioperca]